MGAAAGLVGPGRRWGGDAYRAADTLHPAGSAALSAGLLRIVALVAPALHPGQELVYDVIKCLVGAVLLVSHDDICWALSSGADLRFLARFPRTIHSVLFC